MYSYCEKSRQLGSMSLGMIPLDTYLLWLEFLGVEDKSMALELIELWGAIDGERVSSLNSRNSQGPKPEQPYRAAGRSR